MGDEAGVGVLIAGDEGVMTDPAVHAGEIEGFFDDGGEARGDQLFNQVKITSCAVQGTPFGLGFDVGNKFVRADVFVAGVGFEEKSGVTLVTDPAPVGKLHGEGRRATVVPLFVFMQNTGEEDGCGDGGGS